ncbi:hypothetical protein EV175_006754 [Coemansia sp. RSA 1933]|nr:hypothetical protein EV175_006754 [Coemansia sp. RSA 1933]
MSDHQEGVHNSMLSILDSVAEYRRLRHKSCTSLRQAFFDLSCAKRSAGYQWISPHLYNAHPKAIATVSIADDSSPLEITCVRRCITAGSESSSCSSESDQEEEEQGTDDNEKKPRRRKASDDPLLWFGMLVPPTLKDAQNGFVASLDSLVRLAQLHHAIHSGQDAIQHTMNNNTSLENGDS